MAGVLRWSVLGRNPQLTGVAAAAAIAVTIGLVGLALWWPPFVFVASELEIGLRLITFLGVLLAARRGGSLLMAVWVILIPLGATTILVFLVNDPVVTPSRVVELVGSGLFVGLGTAAPAGVIGYAAGIRSWSGPWEESVEAHLPTSPAEVSLGTVVGWLVVVALITAGASVHLLNLGITWSVLLFGGLAVAVLAGVRSRDATEAVVLGLVTGAGVGIATSTGFSANTTSAAVVFAWAFIGGAVAGLPIGGLGYLAGRALKADMTGEKPTTSRTDEVTA